MVLIIGYALNDLALADPRGFINNNTPDKVAEIDHIDWYGDSLTQGNEDGTGITAPLSLQNVSHVPVNNFGIGGQSSTQIIMRFGAIKTTLTFVENEILGSGQMNLIKSINGVSLAGMSIGNSPDYRLLSTPGSNSAMYLSGVICGQHGTLRRTAVGGPPSNVEIYEFYSEAIFPPKNCPENSIFAIDGSNTSSPPTIYAGGRNNYLDVLEVESNAESFVSKMKETGNTKYLLLTILNADFPNERANQPAYSIIKEINKHITLKYTEHVWDWRTWLISNYDPKNVVDVYNHENDVVPYTMRAMVGEGSLMTSLDLTGCPIMVPNMGSLYKSQTIKVDDEFIYVESVDGNTINKCVRNYGTGGAASSHKKGAHYIAVDPVHLSGAAYEAVGYYIATHFKPNITP